MNDIYDVLEICLQELENGADPESVLARYPDLASELRPILNASIMARARAVPAPAPEVVRRGRAKLLQYASEMREQKVTPRKRMIPLFQRLAISFTLATVFLASGTGLVGASTSALPGEQLYPVKRTWEDVRLFLTFNPEYRETLENTFEDERLHEVNKLLIEGKHETVQYVGVYMEVNGISYVSGTHIVILNTSILPISPLVNGSAVTVTGHTNADGFVDVESITLMPSGSVVPTGEPVEVDANHNDNDVNNGNVNENNSSDENKNNDLNENNNTKSNENVNGNDNFNSNENVNANGNSKDNGNVNDNSNGNSDHNSDSNGDKSGTGGNGGGDGGGDSGGGGGDGGGGGGGDGGGDG